MHLRKALTLGAAVLAASLLALSATATAASPTGGAVVSVEVNGVRAAPNALVGITGYLTSGSYTLGGSTYVCTTGNLVGDVNRGPRPLGAGFHDIALSTFTLNCATPFGLTGTININPGCLTADFLDGATPNVHDGTVDTGSGLKFNKVDGSMTMTTSCGTISFGGGFTCTAKIQGTVYAAFAEGVTTVGGIDYQALLLNGIGLTFAMQTPACAGLLAGAFTLNNFTFNVKVATGTTSGIDFRQTP